MFSLMGDISTALENLQRFDETLPLAEKRVSLCLKYLGNMHPDTLTALHDLGKCLMMQGTNVEAAHKALDVALQGRIRLYG